MSTRGKFYPAIFLFGLALLPRLLSLTAYVATDEAKWILRSAHFLAALLAGDFGAAASQIANPDVEVLAPAVPTLWAGAAGLLARYWLEGGGGSLANFLAGLPYDASEQVPLNFYFWLRLPFVLFTSLFVVTFYLLLRRLWPEEGCVPILAAILLALDPFFLAHSRVIHHDALLTVFMTLALLLLLLAVRDQKNAPWLFLLAGTAWGLALLTKPIALFLAPFAGLLWLGESYRRRWLTFWPLWWTAAGLLTFVVAWPAMWGDPAGTLARLLHTAQAAGAGDSEYSLIPAVVPHRVLELGFLFYPINWLLRWGLLPTIGLVVLPSRWRQLHAEIKPLVSWLALYSLLLMLALAPLGTRDIRYYLPAWPALMILAAVGVEYVAAQTKTQPHRLPLAVAAAAIVCLVPYFPYYSTYYNPLANGPYLAPRLVKIGGGEGMDQVAAYLNAHPELAGTTVATTMQESFRPYFAGPITKHHYDEYASVVVNYIRQIQNGNPSDEYLAYFAARTPDHTVRLAGLDYAYIYLQPSPRPVRNVSFGDATLVAQTLDAPIAQPGQTRTLTLLWQAPLTAQALPVRIQARDSAGQVWVESEGPLLALDGPSAVEGHYTLTLPDDMPHGLYKLWVTVANGNGNDEAWMVLGTLPVHVNASDLPPN